MWLPWEPITFIFRAYSPYLGGCKTLHFSWFWGPRVGRYIDRNYQKLRFTLDAAPFNLDEKQRTKSTRTCAYIKHWSAIASPSSLRSDDPHDLTVAGKNGGTNQLERDDMLFGSDIWKQQEVSRNKWESRTVFKISLRGVTDKDVFISKFRDPKCLQHRSFK